MSDLLIRCLEHSGVMFGEVIIAAVKPKLGTYKINVAPAGMCPGKPLRVELAVMPG